MSGRNSAASKPVSFAAAAASAVRPNSATNTTPTSNSSASPSSAVSAPKDPWPVLGSLAPTNNVPTQLPTKSALKKPSASKHQDNISPTSVGSEHSTSSPVDLSTQPERGHAMRNLSLSVAATTLNGHDSSWKAVGSPPRRPSALSSATGPPSAFGTSSAVEEEDAIVVTRQRSIRTRAASTPNPLFHDVEEMDELDDRVPDTAGSSKWPNLSVQWGPSPSIWNDTALPNPSLISPGNSLNDPRRSLKPDSAANRQHRSFSFSLTPIDHEFDKIDIEPLKGEDDLGSPDNFGQYSVPKARSRSKSSSAIFGLLSSQDNIPSVGFASDMPPRPTSTTQDRYHDFTNIWSVSGASASGPQGDAPRDPTLLHRRASTQPSYPGVWDTVRSPEEEGVPPINIHSQEEMERYRQQQRRFSHAPNAYNDYNQASSNRNPGPEDYAAMEMRRRHSLAGPLYAANNPGRYLSDAFDTMKINDMNEPPNYEDINDYFENTEHRTRAWVEAGKNLQMQSASYTWPLYVVEFKAGRHDFFYVSDPSLVVKKGDLAIVEADRGKDLGKVIHDNIQNMQQLQLYQANHVDILVDSQFGKEVHPKRIYRLAEPNEVAMLVAKSQDEAKAMSLCQTKIRQKKLPMEVVDAEYQWDRKKLTLYFVADRRIDFRELVRELFKIYKTRIWMCAVNPLKALPAK